MRTHCHLCNHLESFANIYKCYRYRKGISKMQDKMYFPFKTLILLTEQLSEVTIHRHLFCVLKLSKLIFSFNRSLRNDIQHKSIIWKSSGDSYGEIAKCHLQCNRYMLCSCIYWYPFRELSMISIRILLRSAVKISSSYIRKEVQEVRLSKFRTFSYIFF